MTSNISVKQDGDKIIITISGIDATGQSSGSGKTKVVASTNGNIAVGARQSDGKVLVLGLNLYYKP